jgi:hypothetical protein
MTNLTQPKPNPVPAILVYGTPSGPALTFREDVFHALIAVDSRRRPLEACDDDDVTLTPKVLRHLLGDALAHRDVALSNEEWK